ncbi:MAG: hypothetical protein LBQ03_02200 [Puniceicoccales bacterium]|jgi:hypothetical protein|nr:hypothetical protein [Puniceicoccales bacterium]
MGRPVNISGRSLQERLVEVPKNKAGRLRSWRSKAGAIRKLKAANDKADRVKILKDKLENGNLGLSGLRDLYKDGTISVGEFAKALIAGESNSSMTVQGFEDRVLQEKGLMGAFCDAFKIKVGSKEYKELLRACLTSPELKNVPVFVADVPASERTNIMPEKDVNTNPDSEFCKSVMEAENIDEMVLAYEQGPSAYKQKSLLCSTVFNDINRSAVELKIGEQTIKIAGRNGPFHEDSNPVPAWTSNNYKEMFEGILSSIRRQSNLEEGPALEVMKQFLLGYRGQNGQSDINDVVGSALRDSSSLAIQPGNNPASMSFSEVGGHWQLSSKVESAPVDSIVLGQEKIASECRFKFPGETEIRTQLSVISTRKESEDGTIEWSCPFRENPPQKVIFYGGNQSVS